MKKYPVGGAAIGLLQVVDAVILAANSGVGEGISLVLSGIEFLWAIVSLIVLIRVKEKPTKLLALAFFGYNVFGWVLAIFVAPQTMPPVVPMWFVVFGGFFGLVYGASSAYVAKRL